LDKAGAQQKGDLTRLKEGGGKKKGSDLKGINGGKTVTRVCQTTIKTGREGEQKRWTITISIKTISRGSRRIRIRSKKRKRKGEEGRLDFKKFSLLAAGVVNRRIWGKTSEKKITELAGNRAAATG